VIGPICTGFRLGIGQRLFRLEAYEVVFFEASIGPSCRGQGLLLANNLSAGGHGPVLGPSIVAEQRSYLAERD
jgi:hypothetical protein